MARLISRSLGDSTSLTTSKTLPLPPISRIFNIRNYSDGSERSAQQPTVHVEADAEINELHRLHDAIRGILIRRSSPDWLPFVPGASFWVPPPRQTLLHVLHRLSTKEYPPSSSPLPCSSPKFFFDDRSPRPVGTKSKKTNPESEDDDS